MIIIFLLQKILESCLLSLSKLHDKCITDHKKRKFGHKLIINILYKQKVNIPSTYSFCDYQTNTFIKLLATSKPLHMYLYVCHLWLCINLAAFIIIRNKFVHCSLCVSNAQRVHIHCRIQFWHICFTPPSLSLFFSLPPSLTHQLPNLSLSLIP